jgi:hypothetical protein
MELVLGQLFSEAGIRDLLPDSFTLFDFKAVAMNTVIGPSISSAAGGRSARVILASPVVGA